MSAVTGPNSSLVTLVIFMVRLQNTSACANAWRFASVPPPSFDGRRIDKKYVPGVFS